ncbi:MAG: hypothetical protein JWM80_4774 [Cyanobacteria bacterium RYN_339]|nr:hypothetical protein [Cyanobacteria bacterium RYN_339]
MSRLVACLLALPVLAAGPALAIDFGSSSTTGKGITMVPFKVGTPRDQPAAVEFGLRWAPGLSDALGAAKLNPQWKDQGSWLLDADLVVMGNFKLADMQFGPMGRFRPIISPYLGGRYLGAPTWEAPDAVELAKQGFEGISSAGTALSYSQYGGVEYGCKAAVDLPLGFAANAGLGLTTLVSGGWDTRRADAASLSSGKLPSLDVTAAGKTNPGLRTLPGLQLGLTWTPVPVFELYVGYEIMTLPTNMRAQVSTLSGNNTVINNLQFGARLFSFSI